jgi:hypothetical protein
MVTKGFEPEVNNLKDGLEEKSGQNGPKVLERPRGGEK